MTDETGGKPLPEVNDLDEIFASAEAMVRNARLDRALTELLAAAEECAGMAETGVERKYWATLWGRDDPGYRRDMAPVRRLRAAVARVRGE